MLVGSPFTQGPKGCWGSSGSQGSKKTSERGRNRNRRRETEMGRDRLHDRRADGRRICKKKKKKEEEKKAQGFSLGCDTQIPKVQAAKMKKPMIKG